MHVGVPKEVKVAERRVGLTPASVRELVAHGHEVTIEAGAGNGIGAPDEVYVTAGATVAVDAEAVWSEADLVVKVKEPQESERGKLREGQLLFTYLHLAPDVPQTEELLDSGATCIAYETVTDARRPAASCPDEQGRRSHGRASGALLESPTAVPASSRRRPWVASGRTVVIGGGVVGKTPLRWHRPWLTSHRSRPRSRRARPAFPSFRG